jgi:hypothetical protein
MSALMNFFDYYSRDALLTLGFFAATGAVMVGSIADRVMRKRGFGAVGNGILILMGIGVGIAISHTQLGPLRSSQFNHVVVMATTSSTIVLLLCGTLKSMLLEED